MSVEPLSYTDILEFAREHYEKSKTIVVLTTAATLYGPSDSGIPTNAELRLMDRTLLAPLMSIMSVPQYRYIYLRFWEECSDREIGELLGMSHKRILSIRAHVEGRIARWFT